MSYDLGLYQDGDQDRPVQVQLHTEGGTYAMNGTTDAELNITYNYSSFFYEHIDQEKGLRWLYGRKAKDCIDRLAKACEALGVEQSQDYWESTPGNAGHALYILLEWAKQHPEGVFNGD